MATSAAEELRIAAAEELRAYEEYVARMAALADGRVILNHTYAHAEIILAQIFRSAFERVNIVTGKLDEQVYGSQRVRDAVTAFLEKNANAAISVVSDEPISDSNPLLQQIAALGLSDRLQIRALRQGMASHSHFAVADGQHLRFEADPQKCEAVVMFGDAKNGKKLDALFSTYQACTV